MTILSPKALTLGSFFKGEDKDGKKPSSFILTSSIFISWIFAKSVTNAANLGADYGIVGGIAYATYWLCIPLAGFVIYRLRRKFKANGLVNFLSDNYGKTAALAFSAAILIRLFNEVWSNSSVIGGYYGASGSNNFIIAASVFTIITLIYSMKGGLLSSLLIAKDLPNLKGIDLGNKSKVIGMSVMALFAIVGNLPMVFGTNILAATTISGTMVMGLAPIFLLHGFIKPTKMGFHLSFWIGIFLGIAYTICIIPKVFAIGNGKSALLLGVNLYGLVLCFLAYIIPGLIKK